jgi:hypothetical protein
LTFEEAIDMMACDSIENFPLRSIFAKDSIEAIFIIAIIDHGLIIANMRRRGAGSKPTVNFDIVSLFVASQFG